MRLLVAGGDRVDAGKTTFSVGLLAAIDGVGFKPRAGNDYWFDHDDYRRAIDEGRLYGKDAKRLAAASAADVAPEAINPVHRLWRPAPDPSVDLLGRADRQFVLDRVGEEYVVHANADAPDSARKQLPLNGAASVESVAELNELTRERYLPAFDALETRIADRDRAVIESYGAVAWPLRDRSVDAVAVVEPGRVRVYDGERYERACREVSGGTATDHGSAERRTAAVTGSIEPVAESRLPALDAETRADPAAIADAYEVAYDALIGVALD